MKLDQSALNSFWMPFTGNRDFKQAPRIVVRAKGMYMYDDNGKEILDGSSGLFCSPLGHCRDEINAAVSAQMAELDYVAPFQTAHPLGFKFAERLAGMLPETINHVFFANSGSESVDTAMKIAYAYHYARGEGQRIRFASRERAYHGVNMGGVSLSGMIKNRQAFGPGVPGVVHMRHTWQSENRFTRGQAETGGKELADDLERIALNYGPDTIAACFVEPIAGSTGCLVPPKGYLERLREICDEHGILLIFDEVITGFGRTGKPFAADAFGVIPDIMTLAKALTNAALPMGAVAASDKVHDAIFNAAPEKAIELFHGYTYSAHPAACAAGLATMDLFEKENSFAAADSLSEYFLDGMFSLSDLPIVTDIRGYGLLAGFDLVPGDAPGMRGLEVQKALFHAGLNLKMTGDSGLLAPPFIAEKSHIDQIVERLRGVLGAI
ncbi:MAG: aminotransferase class III-fold pyridoxal phosphate-dependent enzyme [Proteobacteria bacterium]|nr:aminotransferase class III-fold pyridoxal phosphate-dependent enzyme [Pseudomonadota bacterium]